MPPFGVLLAGSEYFLFFSLLTSDVCYVDKSLCSTPVGLQFEKFIIPDAIRILDAIMETLAF
jgi:hypothetical protein